MKVPKKRRISLSSSPTQSSASIIGGNDDLLTEILVLLPAKSLVKFKSVSKHWKFLISAESFTRLHLRNHGRRRVETEHSFVLSARGKSQLFVCHPTMSKLLRMRLPFKPNTTEYVKILQSCNGLLLLKTKFEGHRRMVYYVFNPSTMQCRDITTFRSRFLPLAICLLFDPSKSPYYRVVAFCKFDTRGTGGRMELFSVYDSATHKWMDGGKFPDVGNTLCDGVGCNNRAYFLRTDTHSLYYSPEEKLCTIPCPPTRKGKKYIVESNGHLHCLYLSFKENMPRFHVAEMIDNQWLVSKRAGYAGMHTICDDTRVDVVSRIVDIYRAQYTTGVELLGMIRADRIEDSMFLFHVPGKIMIYRFDKACELLVDYRSHYFYEESHLQFEFKDVHPFIPTFASV